MAHDAQVIKPNTNESGVSDPVNVFMANGEIVIAWWNAKTNLWYSIDDPTGWAKDVLFWSEIDFPKHNWDYDEKLYAGDNDDNQ